jgi:imidazolonepropionase-like amidohydrolase
MRLALACLLALMLARPAGAADWTCDRSPIAVLGARLWDGTAFAERDVLVANGRIGAVLPRGSAIPSGTRSIDARGHTLLPGLVDAHSHYFHGGESAPPAMRDDPVGKLGPALAAQHLSSGVTRVRIHLFDLDRGPALMRAAEDDCYPAPRLRLGGPGLFGGDPARDGTQAWGVRDVADARAKLRRLREGGAQWVALHNLELFDRALLHDVVAAARAEGIKLMAEADTVARAALALEIGADSIEYIYGDETALYPPAFLAAARARQVPFVPILGFYVAFPGRIENPRFLADRHFLGLSPAERAFFEAAVAREHSPATKVVWNLATMRRKLSQLAAAEVPLAMGTDVGGPYHADALWVEMASWRREGVGVTRILEAATAGGGRLWGDPQAGRITVGAPADFLLYRGDPRRDGFDVGRVSTVAKGGVLFVENGAWVGPPIAPLPR